MKLTIPTGPLVSALASLKPIAKSSTTHPILSNVLLVADKNTLTLTATDMEKQISITLDCRVSKKGSTTLSASRLHDSLSKARGQECLIEVTDKHQATICAGSATTRILGLPPEEMPQPIAISGGTSLTMDAAKLAEYLSNSLLHASNDKTRPKMCSVFFVSRRGKLNIQASCGRRAIIFDTGVDFESKDQFLIPRESVPAMVGICTSGDAEIVLADGVVLLKTPTASLATKLIEGVMQDFEKAFPADRPLQITGNREQLLAIVEYAEVQTAPNYRIVSLMCDGSKIIAKGAGRFIGSETEAFMDMNEDAIPCASGSSELTVVLNPQFLRDALKSLESEDVTMEFKDALTPFVMKDIGVVITVFPINPAALTSKTETK